MNRKKTDQKGYFITGTDTEVGKTFVTFALGTFLKGKGFDVGVMKPVQCSGRDAHVLKEGLNIKDPLAMVNPYYAKEPLSPHLAFGRCGQKIDIERIIKIYRMIEGRHEITLVEGAGGLMVPITKDYFMADLIRDLGLEVIIVSRLGLGTINHTLLTIGQARSMGLAVKGIIFNTTQKGKKGIPERTNPKMIEEIGAVPILGVVPFLEKLTSSEVIKKNVSFDLKALFDRRADKTLTWQKWDKQYIWHPFTQMQDWLEEQPLVIKEGKGCYLKDTQGRIYLDGVSSLWVNVHGHRHKRIDEALRAQINKISHSTLLGLANVPSIELAKKLVEVAPQGLEKVFYSDNGSTAVEVAIKIAYQYWFNQGKKKKNKIMHLEDSYHGDTLGGVSVGGIGLFHQIYRPLTFHAIKAPSPYYYRNADQKSLSVYCKEYLKKIERLLRKHHTRLAAFVVEPLVQGAAGMIVWPRGVLKGIAALCKKYDVLLITDEVATGFGRTGKMFACQHEGVRPDLLCLAKGISAGYLPLAATLTTKEVFNGFLYDYKELKTFFHGHTYTGNPLACAAALANLDVFRKEKTLNRLQPKIKFMANELKKFYNLAHVGDIRQKGFMAGIELVKDKRTKTPFPLEQKVGIRVCQETRERGLILRPLGNVIVIMPPLSITEQELKRLLDITYLSIKHVTENESFA